MESFRISVIIPVYNEAKQIAHNLQVIHQILLDHHIGHEFILIDDGSKDSTWQAIKNLQNSIPDIHAVRLSRNFGKEAALCAGLETVSGDACIVMDGDLQHPPQLIPEMVRKWRNEGYEVVEGVKASRGKETFINKVGAHLFYRILGGLSGFNMDGASDFKLLDARVVDAWKQMEERDTFFRGMSAWVGFNRTTIPFEVADRTEGQSRWSILRLVRLAVTAITSFSALPLQLVTGMGILFLLGSFILGVQTLYMKFCGIAVSGFTTVILLLLIIGSTLMMSLGIIGTYIARIYNEIKFRPRYIIAERTDRIDK